MKPEPFCRTVKKPTIKKHNGFCLDEEFDDTPEETDEYLKGFYREVDTIRNYDDWN